ncbi:MAG: hypothetical protein ACD_38C00071G0001 [uncultured bacterium]|nr:MAG: hypothetical protein ACD_38C00071G0001 [uncultured bacterium]KKR16391.1 MAG: hypothetical protein UT45_C0006G0066 [Candidatus Daviesbacteria bacterium GW2011_GWA2_39_33]OGE21979.1 MAG: hypothetical protein A2778_01530 [Candidatus Daviesbacteria bacterium RIFCSPHIGHO2_01_FULL_40_24]OGE30329.1 MAG: hypothetical protein A3C29_02935 [Candidatus Daviesbacteria bacterium RIFCSPHIGHO2_02_FULL_40_16]OGE42876.1 MAG: hypothetical protein A3A53_06115 [Candidatus Daviesbacteria bacterium RIFCSPLOWO
MNDSNAIELGIQLSAGHTGLQKDIPPSAEQKRSGLERFLDTLELPSLEERKQLRDYYEPVEAKWEQWGKAVEERKGKEFGGRPTLDPGTIRLGEDPYSRDLVVKEAGFILKELMPQVVANIVKILEEQPDIDYTRGTEEFFAKRTADLKSLLRFDFMPEGRPVNAQEQRQLLYALSVVRYMTDDDDVTNNKGGLYTKGIDQLLIGMRGNQSYTNMTEAQRPEVVKQTIEHARMINRALRLVYGLNFQNLPHVGMVDGSGTRNGRKCDTLTFYARRVDPQFYTNYEDQKLKLIPNPSGVEKPASRPIVLK